MPLRNDPQRWGAVAQGMHWLVVVLILVQGSIGLYMVGLPKRPGAIVVYDLHKSLGLTILGVAVLRLAWRMFDRRPPLLPMPVWQRRAALSMHAGLYALLFMLPLSGWLFDSATGLRPLFWWGWLRMPSLTGGPAPQWRDLFADVHETLFWTLVAMAAMHAAIAIGHHVITRDDTLRRMLPRGRRKSNASDSS